MFLWSQGWCHAPISGHCALFNKCPCYITTHYHDLWRTLSQRERVSNFPHIFPICQDTVFLISLLTASSTLYRKLLVQRYGTVCMYTVCTVCTVCTVSTVCTVCAVYIVCTYYTYVVYIRNCINYMCIAHIVYYVLYVLYIRKYTLNSTVCSVRYVAVYIHS